MENLSWSCCGKSQLELLWKILVGAFVEGEECSDGDASGNGDSSPDHLQEASVNIFK